MDIPTTRRPAGRRHREGLTSTDRDLAFDEENESEEDDYEDEDDDETIDKPTYYGFTAGINCLHPMFNEISSAGMMYALAAQISLNTDTMLWWAIVGLTDQFLQLKVGYARYEQDYDHFKQEVLEKATDQNNYTPVLFFFLFL
jgi:hypothetical protein